MTDAKLSSKKCIPCEGGTLPLTKPEAEVLLKQVSGWELREDSKEISKNFPFKNFMNAMRFANRIAQIAEIEGHHPDLMVSWGKVKVSLSTHSIKGLSENDFILAAKIDEIE